jgi:hypothetical protein
MNEIYISCIDWKRKDGYFTTLLIDFGKYNPAIGEIITIQDKRKEGNYIITNIEYNLDDSNILEGVTLVVERIP